MRQELTKLDQAVIEQLGYDELTEECLSTLQDVARHGADGGYGQFIYYADTCEFYDNNRAAILQLVEDMASDLGEEPLTMIAGFNCLKDLELTSTMVAKVIYGRAPSKTMGDDATQVKNALAWFALEETARKFEE